MGDILLLSAGIVMMIIGLLGCVLPVLPGPPLSFVGLLVLHFSKYAEFSFNFLVLFVSIIGEILTGKKSSEAFRAGLGSLMGFLMGVGLKLVTSIVMTYHFVKELII